MQVEGNVVPIWEKLYNIECQLNSSLSRLEPTSDITHIYNPVEYAAELHCEYLKNYLKTTKKVLFIGMNPGHNGMGQTGVELHYPEISAIKVCVYSCDTQCIGIEYAASIHSEFLRKYLNGPKIVLFIGMNPGPNGIAQTGVPFGNISTVKNIMALSGRVDKPPLLHPKRPIAGLERTREEPSGKRLWTLFKKLSNESLDTFFEQCFVHNFCPLMFFNENGNNITPSELKSPYKQQIRDECLRITEEILKLIQPEIIVAIGAYVHDALKKSEYCKTKRLLRLAHPSPRSINNNNWPEKAEQFLIEEDLLKYLKNERNNSSNMPLNASLFYNIECQLNSSLRRLEPTSDITHIYNPVEYAAELHCEYLKHYLKTTKKLLFIGMNPEHDGMGQTGVPFGNISTVKHIMGLSGHVDKPTLLHPERPIEGLESTREEKSGKRLWTLFQKLSNGSLGTFFEQCFVHNFCPLMFFNENGNNITPSELKGPYKQQIRDECLRITEEILKLIQPEIIVAIGEYVHDTLKKSEYCKTKRLLRLAHPSPNNNNWPEEAEQFLIEEDLLKYLKNEA